MLKQDNSWQGIVEWRLASSRLPQLVNMEGEELMMCSTVYEVSDQVAAAQALRRVLSEDEEGSFASKVDVDGQTYVRGWISLHDGTLEMTANSVERFEELRSLVATNVAGALLLSENRENPENPEDLLAASRSKPNHLQEVPPPEVLEALDEHMAEMEEQWLDLSIPALGGATPREAVADPQLRGELEALLDDFEWSARQHTGPGDGCPPHPGRTWDLSSHTFDAGRVKPAAIQPMGLQPIGLQPTSCAAIGGVPDGC